MQKTFQTVLVLCIVFMATLSCIAGEPTDQIKETTDRVLAILASKEVNDEEKREQVRKLVDEQFDWWKMSKLVLGRHWKQRTDTEKKHFVKLFGKLIEKVYGDKVLNSSGGAVSYEGEAIKGKRAIVKSKITTSTETEVLSVVYRMHKKDDKWLVYDVIIEGVSLVKFYRAQFEDVISSEGYKKAIERLEKKFR